MEIWTLFTEFLDTFFTAIHSNYVSSAFAYAIFIVFFISLFGLGAKTGFLKNIAAIAPSLLTTLGILGTFTGIFIGLIDFDVATITKSVPTLLEGLKIAFGTSILGLFAALIFRVLRPILSPSDVEAENAESEVIDAFREMSASLKRTEQTNKEGFDALIKALTGNEDNSVAVQLERLRGGFANLESTTKQGFDEQIKEFKDFAEKMSEAFSKAIIDELKAVIREFNEKISEQFGENFKKLNEAVGNLLEWQERYRQHIEELEENFKKTTDSLSSTEDAITAISVSASAIPEQMERFDAASERLNQQLLELHKGLSSLEEMRQRAEGAFPAISDKIDEIITSAEEAVSSMNSAVTKQMESLEDASKQMNNSVGEITNNLENSVKQLDEAMQREIGQVVQAMAENLSGITLKFVEDYAPLLDEIRKIVEMAEHAQQQGRNQ